MKRWSFSSLTENNTHKVVELTSDINYLLLLIALRHYVSEVCVNSKLNWMLFN